MLAFGPDGCLFLGSGDGGGSGDPNGNGQRTDTPLGKILRVDVDNPTTAAPGNLAGAGYPHIWDYGIRNPWRFSFDRMTGDLYIGDVGQGAWEEVDVEPKGSGGHNYGWNEAEGNHCYGGSCTLGDFVGAVDEYAHANNDNCVVGGYVYRGTRIPSLQGWYLHADNGSNRIRAFVWDGAGACRPFTLSDRDSISVDGDITSFGEDAAGEIYVVTSTSVYRIDPQ
jgi:glucose/arabinose dehydrogenase